MALFVDVFAEAERSDAIGFVGNDGLCAALFEPFAQGRAVVCLVAKQFLRRFVAADETLRLGTVMGFAAAQEEG